MNPFSHFLFFINSTKKFSFEPKLKDQKIKLVFESSLLYIWGKNELYIIYDASWNQGHIQGKIKQWNISERSTFLKNGKILLLVCSIKQYSFESSLDNSSIQTLFFSLSLLFGTKDKKKFPSAISHYPHWGEYPLPLLAIWKTLTVVTYEQKFVEHSQVLELFATSNPVLN